MNQQLIIRSIRLDELSILKDLLYEAIFQPEGTNPLPKDVIDQPEIRIYIEDWGKPDDLCLVAAVDNKIAGAVWTRILNGSIKGYGNIDATTPEFAISLFKEYRNQGIGTKLMESMISLLKEKGYKQTSLSVDKENYAFRMYQNVGFKIISQQNYDYIMLLQLND